MYENYTHPLLAQVPLTVSPFVSLPTATTLPYTYKSLPSTLPPISTTNEIQSGSDVGKPRFIVSSSGNRAHPDEIIASCEALQAHLRKQQEDAKQTLQQWQDDIRERELAEKRRLAPGYLDSEAKILQPEKATSIAESGAPASLLDTPAPPTESIAASSADTAGAELDRAFGGMSMK